MERIRLDSGVAKALRTRGPAERQAGATSGTAFRDNLALAQVSRLNERIEQALTQIDVLGARLGETLSLADLKAYKQAVAVLVRDLTSHMVQVRAQTDWDTQSWESRTMVILRNVDTELENLTAMILDHEQDHLAILEKIGEIKGMLLDVRM